MVTSAKLVFSFIVFFVSPLAALAQEKSETFLVTGMGSTHELAVQNAASNALTTAVGKFVDVRVQIEKRTEIKDGVAQITKDLSENFIASSNGTIERIEVLSSKSESGLFSVEAVIDVRMSDLRKAMAGRIEVSRPMDKGIFSAVKANKENAAGKLSALVDNIFIPLQSTDLFSVAVDAPFDLKTLDETFSQLGGVYNRGGWLSYERGLLRFLPHLGKFTETDAYYTGNLLDSRKGALKSLRDFLAGTDITYLVVPVNISIEPTSFASFETTAASLSSEVSKFAIEERWELVSGNGSQYDWNWSYFKSMEPASLKFCFMKTGISINCYRISGLPVSPNAAEFPVFAQLAAQNSPYSKLTLAELVYNLKVSIVSEAGDEVSSFETIDGAQVGYNGLYDVVAPARLEGFPSLVTSHGHKNMIMVVDKKRINIVFPLNEQQLAAAHEVKIEIIPPSIPYR